MGVRVFSKWISPSTCFRFFSVLVIACVCSSVLPCMPQGPGYYIFTHPCFFTCPAPVAESHSDSLKCLATHVTACPGPVQHFPARHPGPRLLLTSCPPALGCFPGDASGKVPANAGDVRDTGSIPGSGRSPRVGNGKPLQYSCLESPMDRGAWQTAVHGIAKSWKRLSEIYLSQPWAAAFSLYGKRQLCYLQMSFL